MTAPVAPPLQPPPEPPLDLDAYFARTGHAGSREPTLATLHAVTAAHTRSIPFENLDVLLGRPIRLDGPSLFDKLVVQGRGGYCFEQNGLLLRVLRQLGFAARPLSARVRIGRPREAPPPARTHLFVAVTLGDETWLTDVGVGGASLTQAIRFEVDLVQETSHDTRRIVRDGDAWFHQVRHGDVWTDVYELSGEEMPEIDRIVASWYTSTHPDSHFRHGLMAARVLADGRRAGLLNRELTLRERDGSSTSRPIETASELLDVLRDTFGLHFPAGTRFGEGAAIAPLPWPT